MKKSNEASCYNRVSQQGIKVQLEIIKTEARGWGVTSLNSIPSGSFICEYAGELLEEKEAKRRTSNDEYLFDVGNNYNDGSLGVDFRMLCLMHQQVLVELWRMVDLPLMQWSTAMWGDLLTTVVRLIFLPKTPFMITGTRECLT
ncbi:hypothetical protein CUMW_215700 [Citrus unshiu]|uniref:SET domain-containing protein n=1 Tax=Citrus unshiu TaxID=55188 RepID=A0A2H5QC03_CITUN|nr:hypothetical protein CUMW_215700 [Citrus unshiu]